MFAYFWDSEIHLNVLALIFESIGVLVELSIAVWLWSIHGKEQTKEFEHRKERLEIVATLIAAILFAIPVGVTWRGLVLQSRSEVEQLRLKIELQNLREFAGPRHLTDDKKLALSQTVAKLTPVSFQLQFDPSAEQDEAAGIARDIANALVAGGWKYDGNIGAGGMSLSVSGTPPPGIGIVGPQEYAAALISTLTNSGLSAHFGGWLSVYGKHGDVLIFIGRKPTTNY